MDCLSLSVRYIDCRCVYDKNYPMIEMEFNQCECCNTIIEQPLPDTEFNRIQFKKMKEEE